MSASWRKQDNIQASLEQTIRSKYANFRNLLSLNNDCLEILADVQPTYNTRRPAAKCSATESMLCSINSRT